MILIVKKFILIMLALPVTAMACSGWVIGFRGLNEVFDYEAFADYASNQGLCFRSFGWQDLAEAERFIQRIATPYHLYGFSRGAQTVAAMLQQGRVRPESVITVGAYRTVNVNFDRYGIPYRNYFDRSGRGQQSPGIFLDVDHGQIQRVVTTILKGKNSGRVANVGHRASLINS